MDDDTRNSTDDGLRLRTDERIANLEKIALILPVVAAEALLISSLFLPFVTVTSYDRDDQAITLSQLGLALFGVAPASSAGLDTSDLDAVGLLFGIAFLGLFVVVLCSVVGLAVAARGRIADRAARVLTTVGVLLVIGAVGAWLVIALGSTSESPWLPEAGSLTLAAGALLAAMLLFLAPFRAIWIRR